ncbi:MAG: cell division ATP-binding protein FtsE [bacterium]
MIKINNLTKHYLGNVEALEGVDLEIEQGEFVSLIGRSGSGKSTLAKLLIAEEKPTAGTIKIDKWNVTTLKSKKVPFYRRQIGVVFQDYKLLQKKTVYENVEYALLVSGESNELIEKIVPKIIDLVGLKGKEERFPKEMSGGEQQRVAIARAMVHNPKLLIADEPTGNLDIFIAEEIVDLLLKINELGTTVLLATHNKDLVDGLKKRVITIENGKIVNDQKKGKYTVK